MIFTKKWKNFLRLNGLKLGLASGILLHCGYRQGDCMLALPSEFSITFLEIELSCFWVSFRFTEIGKVAICFRTLNFLKEDSVFFSSFCCRVCPFFLAPLSKNEQSYILGCIPSSFSFLLFSRSLLSSLFLCSSAANLANTGQLCYTYSFHHL